MDIFKPSNLIHKTPKTRVNIIDKSAYNSRNKDLDPMNHSRLGNPEVEQRDKILEERFNSLIKRFEKSKEILEGVNKPVLFNDVSPMRITAFKNNEDYNSGNNNNPFETKRSLLHGIPTSTLNYSLNNHNKSKANEHDYTFNNDVDNYRSTLMNQIENSIKRRNLKHETLIYSSSSDSENDKNNKDDKKHGMAYSNKSKDRLNKEIEFKKTAFLGGKSTLRSTKRLQDNNERLMDDMDMGRIDSKHTTTKSSINRLKLAIKQDKALDYEKYVALKDKARDLKNTLREYVKKCFDLEEIVNNKNKIILSFEEEIKSNQQELLSTFSSLKELKKFNEIYKQNEEEFKGLIMEYKSRLTEQKKQIEHLEEYTTQSESRNSKELDMVKIENLELKRTMDIMKEREAKLIATMANQQKELDEIRLELSLKTKVNEGYQGSFKELKEAKEELEHVFVENKDLARNLEEARNRINDLEDRLSKQKKKSEDEKLTAIDDLQKRLEVKNEKVKLLKVQIQDLEKVIEKMTNEKRSMTNEVENVIEMRAQYEREYDRLKGELNPAKSEIESLKLANNNLKNENDDLFKNFQDEIDRATNLQVENKKLMKMNKHLEEKLIYQENDQKIIQDVNNRLREELKNLSEDNLKKKEELIQHERHIDQLMKKKQEELEKLEKENQVLKTSESQLLKDIEVYKTERDHYKKEYKALKSMNRSLEKDIYEIDNKVKDFIREKNQEIIQQNKEITTQKQVNSKLKVLEDIQSMIKSHRTAQKSKFELSEIA